MIYNFFLDKTKNKNNKFKNFQKKWMNLAHRLHKKIAKIILKNI